MIEKIKNKVEDFENKIPASSIEEFLKKVMPVSTYEKLNDLLGCTKNELTRNMKTGYFSAEDIKYISWLIGISAIGFIEKFNIKHLSISDKEELEIFDFEKTNYVLGYKKN